MKRFILVSAMFFVTFGVYAYTGSNEETTVVTKEVTTKGDAQLNEPVNYTSEQNVLRSKSSSFKKTTSTYKEVATED
jgi:hypothetical protein